MAPNANEELASHDATERATSGPDYDTPGSGGDYVNRGYSRGDYGSGSQLFASGDQFESRIQEGTQQDNEYRRDYEGGRRGSFFSDGEPEFSGPYGANRIDSRERPEEQMYRGGFSYRQGSRGLGYGRRNRFDSSPFGRYSYVNRDQSPFRRDRFDTGPFGRQQGVSFETYGYRSGDYGRYGAGRDYGRYGDYGRSGYSSRGYGGYGNGDSYASRYGSRGFGEDFGRPYGYGRGSGMQSYGGEYGRPGYGGQFSPYGYGRFQYGRDFNRYGLGYGSYGARKDYGSYGRDLSPYERSRYGPYSSQERHGYGGGQYGSYYGRDSYGGFGSTGRFSYGSGPSGGFYGGSYGSYRPYESRDSYYGRRYPQGTYGYGSTPYGSSYLEQYPSRGSNLQSSQYRGSPYDYDSNRYSSGYRSSRDQSGVKPISDFGYRRNQYGYSNEYNKNQFGYDRDQFGYGGSRYGVGGGQYGYGSNQYRYGGKKYGYGRDQYGQGREHYGYGSQQYGQGRDQYGYGSQQYGQGDQQSGDQYGYRPGVIEGRGQVTRGQFEFSGKYPGDYQSMPPPFPPFSQPRSYYPSTFNERSDEEELVSRERKNKVQDMAVRVAYDLQRRRHYEHPTTDPTQNTDLKISNFLGESLDIPDDVLRVAFVDLQPNVNCKEHRTFQYESIHYQHPTAIFRRGQTFFMIVNFQNRDFDSREDCLFLNFYIGPHPSVPKRTRVVLPIDPSRDFQRVPQHWDARVQSQQPGQLTLEVHIPSSAPVGMWHCVVETSLKQCQKARLQYLAEMDMYILFNPFCADDTTFMDHDDLRTEYLMNDSGKIFIGGFKSARGRPWVYGQFDDCVLPAACILLEMSQLAHSERGNATKVARAIGSMIRAARNGSFNSSSFDKSTGVIIPRYEDEFRGGASPHLWTGSAQIIEEFLKGGASPVKFGHCWVMSALMTTFCRALGLLARPVTAFVAALSTQDTLTVDRYVDQFGDILEGGPRRDQPDSLWAFHTWCEVWMSRPDLPTGHSGWQACDPSRSGKNSSEKQLGACGPCSTEAVRKGDIGFNKDSDVFYAFINAFVRYFHEEERSEWGFLPFVQFRFPVARYILTKGAKSFDDEGDGDCEDITERYKDMQIRDEDKMAIVNASRGVMRDSVHFTYPDSSVPITKLEDCDVTFEFVEPVRAPLGEPFKAILNIHNNSNVTRTIQANISCRSTFYTGVMGPHIKRTTGQFALEEGQTETLTLILDLIDYQDKLVDMAFIKVTSTGFVNETMQSFVEEFDFRFDKPKLVIEMPEECQVKKECQAEFSFMNPLDMALTDCFLTFEVSGSVRPKTIPFKREVPPKQLFSFRRILVPRSAGLRQLVATFSSKQLSDIIGTRSVVIRDY